MSVSTRIRLRVNPGAAQTAVVGRHGDGWKVRVKDAPEGGKANAALVAFLADTLRIAQRDVTLVAGRGSRDKIVAVTGLDSEATDAALDRAAQGERVA